jgi:hypothetical protein
MQVIAGVAKLWQWDGIAAVETGSKTVQEVRFNSSWPTKAEARCQTIAMKEFSCELFCSKCVGHDCHVPSGRSGSIGRPVSESVSSQGRVGAGS